MAASFPTSVATFTTQVDFESVDSAENINALQNEVQAIESVLGALVGTTAASSTGPGNGTVLAQMSYLNSNKSPIGHSHTQFGSIALGGSTTAQYVEVSGDTINANNAANPAPLTLQSNGGDIVLGTSASQVSIYGSLNLQGTSNLGSETTTVVVTSSSVSASESVTTASLNATNATIDDNLKVGGSISLTTEGGAITFENGQAISDLPLADAYSVPGLEDITQFGNTSHSLLYSRFAVQGQLWAHKNRVGSTNDWRQASIICGRTNEEQATLGFAGLNEQGVGSAWAIQMNNNSANLGIQHHNGDGTYCPVSASSFVTSSSERFKDDITDLTASLDHVTQLRPVSFTQSTTGHHVNGIGLSQEENAKIERARDRKLSTGEARRRRFRRYGLVAEEVAAVMPEVIGYDEKGRPEGIDYSAVTGVLVNAVKELAGKVSELQAQVAALSPFAPA